MMLAGAWIIGIDAAKALLAQSEGLPATVTAKPLGPVSTRARNM